MSTPERLSRYEIIREVGRGGMATLYLAHDPNFDRNVAVKVLPRQFTHDPQFRARFRREAQSIAKLEHPAIVPVYDFGEEDGQPFLVMRFMQGGTLGDRIEKSGAIPLAETVRIVRQIAPAMDRAHESGVIHRDIKPANTLFDQSNNAFISDFGIAKLAEATAQLTGNSIVGTAAYMSPEQIRGEDQIDGRSDIYSLAIMVYEMLVGDVPYKAETLTKQLMKHVLEPVPRITAVKADVSPEVEAVLVKALAKSPDERYPTTVDFARALDVAVNGTAAMPALTTQFGDDVPKTEEMPALVGLSDTMIDQPRIVTQALPAETARKASPETIAEPAPAPVGPAVEGSSGSGGGGLPLSWIAGGVGGLILIGLIGFFLFGRGDNPTTVAEVPTETATSEPTEEPTEVLVATEAPTEEPTTPPTETAEPTETLTPTSEPTETAEPTETPEPTWTPTLEPTWTPTAQPAVVVDETKRVQITDILLNDGGFYEVYFNTSNYTANLPGEHIHFYFSFITEADAGVPGGGPWQIYPAGQGSAATNPFTLYTPADRMNADSICAVVANADHSIQSGTGNCFPLP